MHAAETLLVYTAQYWVLVNIERTRYPYNDENTEQVFIKSRTEEP
jgi:hypothetical protein